MFKNVFDSIPMYEGDLDYGPLDYIDLKKLHEEFTNTKKDFPPIVSGERLPEILNEVSIMKQVGFDALNPPQLDDVLPAIRQKLEAATNKDEYMALMSVYERWLYSTYGKFLDPDLL